MKKTLIYGNARTGRALRTLLGKVRSTIYDDNIQLSELTPEQAINNIHRFKAVIYSPSVPYRAPLLEAARQKGILTVGEFEYATSLIKAKQIAVTGTNGKTTVCRLVAHILKLADIKACLGGNIGVPASTLVGKKYDYAILEASSFQLQSFEHYAPYVSALLNVASDHLDVHANMQEYIQAKCNIFGGQSKGDYAILNYDDVTVRDVADRLCKSSKIFYSVTDKSTDCFLDNETIVFRHKTSVSSINLENIKYYSTHSISNILCATAICSILGVSMPIIADGIVTFLPDKYRITPTCCVNGVAFYNDSKGTNIHATLSAMASLRHYCLIVGGSDKGEDYNRLFECIDKRCVFVAVTGANASAILQAADSFGWTSIAQFTNLREAVLASYTQARNCRADVLFSPASASYDAYTDYAQRGAHFDEIVYEISATC